MWGGVSNAFARIASNRRQDFVFALPISFCSIVIGQSWSEEVGMTIAVAIAFSVGMLSGLTVLFTKLREEIKRDLPREEL
jgi:diacylglycerol kinase